MAGKAIELTWEGYAELMQALTRASTPQLLELAGFAGEELMNVSREAFKKKADPATDKPWKEKKDGTEATLYDSGSLFRNVNYEACPDGSVILGNNKVYAGVHQDGWSEHNIPARPYMGYNDGIIRNIMNAPEIREILEI